MVETNWRAVAIGFVTIAVLGIVGAYVEPLAALGTVLGAVIGGFVAGYYTHMGTINGAWNGLLAGSIGALVLIALFAVLGLVVSVVELSLGGVFATVGIGLAALVIVVFAALPAALGGALGGMMGGAEPSEVRSPST